jgi:SAM-dependent methyltransferase
MSYSDVDASRDPQALVGQLDVRAANLAAIKAEMRQLASVAPGDVVIDLGCGAGHDLAELARSGHRAVGMDRSSVMLEHAQARLAATGVPAGLARALVEALPFRTGSVAACLADRVLQHVADPATVLAEVHRVLSPGGRLVIFEPDWGTFSIDLADSDGAQALSSCVAGGVAQRRIGLQLHGLLVRAGFTGIDCRQMPIGVTNLARLQQSASLDLALRRAVRTGLLSRDRAERLEQAMAQASAAGTFWASHNRYLVTAVRP